MDNTSAGMWKMNYNIFGLHVLTDRVFAYPRQLFEVINLVLSGGASVIQLRDKTASFEEMFSLGKQLKELTADQIPLIINDRIDVALALDASGVHIGQKDIPAKEARKRIGHKMILGVSTSSTEQAIKAQDDGADYLGVGPIFPTMSKMDTDPAIGLSGLKKIKESVKIPVIAIGGISMANASEVMDIADGIAVISAVLKASDPEKAVRDLIQILKK